MIENTAVVSRVDGQIKLTLSIKDSKKNRKALAKGAKRWVKDKKNTDLVFSLSLRSLTFDDDVDMKVTVAPQFPPPERLDGRTFV